MVSSLFFQPCFLSSDRHLGSFKWGSSNFGASAKNVELQDGKVLCAHLKRKDGSWTEKPVTVNLTEHITNNDGTLRRTDKGDVEMIAPDVCEKLDAVSRLIRNQQAVIDNGAFQLEFITAANQRMVLQELEVAFLRLSKLAACIKGEFDEEQKDGGVPQSNPDAVLRPMIRSFENISTKADKALGQIEKIFEFVSTLWWKGVEVEISKLMLQAGEHQNTCIPALQRDLDSLRIEIDTEVTLVKPSIDAIQEKIAESITAIQANQLVLKEANAAKGKTKSMETLVRIFNINYSTTAYLFGIHR